ncbi:MAG TPA: CDP-diacylglycerol--serine O-phosphatidyltransferase, partial [Thermoanaerobaculia bacterium]
AGRGAAVKGARTPGAGRRFDRVELARRTRRGAYLLPSLFTIGNMLLGFYAVVLGMRSAGLVGDGQPTPTEPLFGRAALLVFLAGLLDGLDGRLARMTGTESEFGREYDSLADVVTFGMAPALLTYTWGIKNLGRDAWVLPAFYLVCMATRLARFNVQTVTVVDSRHFAGRPAPAAALAICSLLFVAPGAVPSWVLDPALYAQWRTWMQFVVAGALVLVGVLMVSTFRYPSFKKIDLRKPWSYRAAVPLAAVLLVVVYLPRAPVLVVSILYTLYGPAAALVRRLRPQSAAATADPPPSESSPSSEMKQE